MKLNRVRLTDLFQMCDDNAGHAFLERLKKSRKPDEKLYFLKHRYLHTYCNENLLMLDGCFDFYLDGRHEYGGTICKFRNCDIRDIEATGFDLYNFDKVEVEDE